MKLLLICSSGQRKQNKTRKVLSDRPLRIANVLFAPIRLLQRIILYFYPSVQDGSRLEWCIATVYVGTLASMFTLVASLLFLIGVDYWARSLPYPPHTIHIEECSWLPPPDKSSYLPSHLLMKYGISDSYQKIHGLLYAERLPKHLEEPLKRNMSSLCTEYWEEEKRYEKMVAEIKEVYDRRVEEAFAAYIKLCDERADAMGKARESKERSLESTASSLISSDVLPYRGSIPGEHAFVGKTVRYFAYRKGLIDNF